MGGHHKKFTRKEKSKVKLKAKKTVLTKAQNVTDTSFKVRKIVLKEQLKAGTLNELLTRKHLNVKELLSRLHHNNVSMRKSSLEGLQELVKYHSEEILSLHLAGIIEGAARLILDEEKDVRKDALNLLNIILSQVPLSNVFPFFNVLLNYLNCGLTHIHTSIQDDSLAMLDILLASTPLLVAANADTILRNFLDMISSLKADSSSERTLSVHLGNRFTSITWRMKVLDRLKGLLSAITAYKKQQGKKSFGQPGVLLENLAFSHDTWNWRNDSELLIPIYNQHYRDKCILPNVLSVGNSLCENSTESKHLKGFVNVLMPLLIETWREVAPSPNLRTSNSQECHSMLSLEAAQVLKCILEIIELLCELLTSEATEYITAHRKDFDSHFFRAFPYVCTQSREKGKKAKRDQKDMNQDPRCLTQNLSICYLFYCFYEGHQMDVKLCTHMLKYVKSSVQNWKEHNGKHQLVKVVKHLLQCTKCWDCQDISMREMLDSVITHCMRTRENDMFELLSDVAITPHQTHLHRHASFHDWMKSLPELLCSPTIPARTVEVLAKLACQSNPVFNKSLCEKVPDILNNLNSVIVTGAESECKGRKSISNILYWVKDWSRDALITLANFLQNELWDKELASHIDGLLALRKC